MQIGRAGPERDRGREAGGSSPGPPASGSQDPGQPTDAPQHPALASARGLSQPFPAQGMDRWVNQYLHECEEFMFTKEDVPSPWPFWVRSSQEGECRILWEEDTCMQSTCSFGHSCPGHPVAACLSWHVARGPTTPTLCPDIQRKPASNYHSSRREPPGPPCKFLPPSADLWVCPQLAPLCWSQSLTALGLRPPSGRCSAALRWLASREQLHAEVSPCPGQRGLKGLAVKSPPWLASR